MVTSGLSVLLELLNLFRMAVKGGPGVTRDIVLARLNEDRLFCCSCMTCLNLTWKKCLGTVSRVLQRSDARTHLLTMIMMIDTTVYAVSKYPTNVSASHVLDCQ